MSKSIVHDFDDFLINIDWNDIVSNTVSYFNNCDSLAEKYLLTIKQEARFGLDLILPYLDTSFRILEVGAGMGLLATFLCSKGFNITALEPGLGGFGISTLLKKELGSLKNISHPNFLDIPAQELSCDLHGKFDFIYSINVLEHIPNLDETIIGLTNVLAKHGIMIHACPNYAVPYEPHFGIPLIPFFPKLTPLIFKKCRNSELWNSLNFVSTFKLKRICTKNNLVINYHREVLYKTFRRLENDSEFRQRQSNHFIKCLFFFLNQTRLINLTRFMPPQYSTLMVFELNQSIVNEF
jgi:2-polyprenyl-3-methyl-5-hydroxy-6-metoxy-1,4-benzoquinol methylase